MKQPRSSVWMPVYIGDYLGDTMHLNDAEHGAYFLLMMHYWRNGPLPDDDRQLTAIAHCPMKRWKETTGPCIRAFFRLGDDGKLHQKRIDIELSKATRVSDVRSKVAANRWGKREQTDIKSTANVMQLHTHARAVPQSQSQKSTDLRSVADAPAPEDIDDKTRLWREGIPVLQRLLGVPEAKARVRLGQWCKTAQDDPVRVLEAILEADRIGPADPGSWLTAALRARAGPEPAAPDDPRGVRAWCVRSGFKPTVAPADRADGDFLHEGWIVDKCAHDIAEAARLPDRWRGDWTPLAEWLTAGAEFKAIEAVVRRLAERPGYRPVVSLKFFDRAVREDALPQEEPAS